MKSEDRIQADCFQWLWNNYLNTRGLVFHVPNGGLRNKREANKLRSMGVVAGIPDIVIIIPGKLDGLSYPALFIEMKDETGTVSKVQKRRHIAISAAGPLVRVCRSEDEFKSLVLAYLEGSEYLQPVNTDELCLNSLKSARKKRESKSNST